MMNKSKYAKEFMENGKLLSVPTIDAHTHMGAVYGTSLSMSNADEMIEMMDRQNIEMVFCSPHSALFDPAAMNTELEDAMCRYPGRIKGFFSFNPNYAQEYLAKIDDVLTIPGYIGFKFLPAYHRYALDGEGFRKVLEFIDYNKLVLLVHTWGSDPYNSTKQVENVLKKYPELTLIMGHSAPGECEKAITLASQYENVYLDLCDIHRHNGIVDKMVEGAGADKVLFGTDMPWYDPTYCLGSILFSHISDEEKYKIIYGNAKKIADRF